MNAIESQHLKNRILLIVLFLIPLGGMGLDLYSPSLPYIEKFMQTSHQLVKLTISIYLLGYAIGQLFFGVISDATGRRKPLLTGLIIYIVISFMCTQIQNIHWFLFFRLIQGLAIAASAVMCKSILGDCFKDQELAKATTWLVTVWGLGPIIAPLIGGYLQFHINWQANFYFFTAYGLASLLTAGFFLPETCLVRSTLGVKSLLSDIWHILIDNKIFILGIVLVTIGYAIIATFNLLGPYLVQNLLNYNAAQYGHIAFVLGLAFFLGSLSNRYLLKKFNATSILQVAVILFFVTSLLMHLYAMFVDFNILVLLIPNTIIFFLSGWLLPNGMARCLSLYPHKAGTASAVMSFLFIFFTSSFTALISLIPVHSALVLSLTYCVLALVGIFIFYLFKLLKHH